MDNFDATSRKKEVYEKLKNTWLEIANRFKEMDGEVSEYLGIPGEVSEGSAISRISKYEYRLEHFEGNYELTLRSGAMRVRVEGSSLEEVVGKVERQLGGLQETKTFTFEEVGRRKEAKLTPAYTPAVYSFKASSAFTHAGYFPETKVLRVRFQAGTVWNYFDVPAVAYANLCNQDSRKDGSPGKFFNEHIKGRFNGIELKDSLWPLEVDEPSGG